MSSLSANFASQRKRRPMLVEWLIKISDYGDAAISKAIHHFGIWVGVAGGTAVQVAAMEEPVLPPFVLAILPYGKFITIVAGSVLVLKYVVDMTISILKFYYERKDKAAESEQIQTKQYKSK